MNFPSPGDYIDIHNHGASPAPGIFSVENLMAHEKRLPDSVTGMTFTFGIHPWHLDKKTFEEEMSMVRTFAGHENVIAIGEAGFDRLKGPEIRFQEQAFEEQVIVSEEAKKPLFIHCVRAWEDLLSVHKRIRPEKPWIIHGFRGKKELALQLISRGMYISFWFDFIIRNDSSELVRSLPVNRIFLETDGSGMAIQDIYKKVSTDLNLDESQLRELIRLNFTELFQPISE